jgi:hypothetical protein
MTSKQRQSHTTGARDANRATAEAGSTVDVRRSHFVPAGQTAVDEAMEMDIPVTAACGKVWVPSSNPNDFYLCPDCLEAICGGWAA